MQRAVEMDDELRRVEMEVINSDYKRVGGCESGVRRRLHSSTGRKIQPLNIQSIDGACQEERVVF